MAQHFSLNSSRFFLPWHGSVVLQCCRCGQPPFLFLHCHALFPRCFFYWSDTFKSGGILFQRWHLFRWSWCGCALWGWRPLFLLRFLQVHIRIIRIVQYSGLFSSCHTRFYAWPRFLVWPHSRELANIWFICYPFVFIFLGHPVVAICTRIQVFCLALIWHLLQFIVGCSHLFCTARGVTSCYNFFEQPVNGKIVNGPTNTCVRIRGDMYTPNISTSPGASIVEYMASPTFVCIL